MRHKKRIVVLIASGLLCLTAALGLTVYNIWDEQRATVAAEEAVTYLTASIPSRAPEAQPLAPEPQAMMTTITMDDRAYIGILEIPALGKVLPIQGTWSESLLKHSPCLYEGDLYEGMIIAGHNYRSHFTGLTNLSSGDEVRFTDVDGNVWHYTVSTTQVIGGYDVDGMKDGDWDLTLFTCTYGGQDRFTVRCTLANS